VVVRPVDDRDLDVFVFELLRRKQSAEARADDYDVVAV